MSCRGQVLTLAIVLALASNVRAQEHNYFAIGGDFGIRHSQDATVAGAADAGLNIRFGHSEEGWGFGSGLSWFASDVTTPIGGVPVELGELHVRPFMVGYGYTHMIGRVAISTNLLGGFAFTSFNLSSPAAQAWDRLGARAVDADASSTFVLKPEVEMWIDLTRKIGLNLSAGYMIARPDVRVTTSLGREVHHVDADMMMIRAGVVYRILRTR